MRALPWFLLCFGLSVSALSGQDVFYFPQVGNGEAGPLRFKTEVVFVNTGTDDEVTLEFFDSAGDPLVMELGNETDSMFVFPLKSGEGFSARTSGTGELAVGYARVTSQGDSIGGTAVFTGIDVPSGAILFEAGVPAADELGNFTVFVDSIGTRDTGLAMLNPPVTGENPAANGPANVMLTLYDKSFSQIATTDVPLEPGQKEARFVWEFFQPDTAVVETAKEMEGVLTVQGPPLAAVTLRQNNPVEPFPQAVTTLTTFPVTPGVADAVVSSSSFASNGVDRLEIKLDTSSLPSTATSVKYRPFEGDRDLGQFSRMLGLNGRYVHQLRGIQSQHVTRVEVVLMKGVSEIGRFHIR